MIEQNRDPYHEEFCLGGVLRYKTKPKKPYGESQVSFINDFIKQHRSCCCSYKSLTVILSHMEMHDAWEISKNTYLPFKKKKKRKEQEGKKKGEKRSNYIQSRGGRICNIH